MARETFFMRYKLLLGLLLILQALTRRASSATPLAATNMTDVLENIRKKHDLPALAGVVVKDGKIVDRGATGIRKMGNSALVTTNDVFHIGSCTKSMTATLAAMLIEDRKLRWNTTIPEVFPEFKGKMDSHYEAVTVEELLTHRGGVPGSPPPEAWLEARKQRGTPVQQRLQFIEAVLRQPPEAAPGTKMIYSNQGYSIVGAMLEKLAGKPWETLITERLFRPLHMSSAGFGPPGSANTVDEPWGHTRELANIVPMWADNPPAIAPAGCVHCSLDDLARFTIFHIQRSPVEGLLRQETLVRLHSAPDNGEYACGWVVVERLWAGGTALMHNGSNMMWYVVMWLAPEKDFSVIAATNIAGKEAAQACDETAAAMIHTWLAK